MFDIFNSSPLNSAYQAIKITTDVLSSIMAVSVENEFRSYENRRLRAHSLVQVTLSEILRDVVGDPFQSVLDLLSFAPKTWELAQEIYDNLSFERMPELADQLGLEDPHNFILIAHCRQSRTHNRGCWVLDTILEKE